MIHNTKVHNKIIEEKEKRIAEKERCTRCRLWRTRYHNHADRNEVQEEEDERIENNAEVQIKSIIEEILEDTIQIIQIKKRIEYRDCCECNALLIKKREEDCEECGVQPAEEELALVGMDAVALFPSLTSKRTARIVRERVRESKMIMEGFNWKKGLIYILINKEIPSKIPTEVRKYFPFRKSNKGVKPGMTSKGMTEKEGSEERQWIFPKKNPGEGLVREIISIVAEIAVRVLWENYAYDFGGNTYLQSTGGPIGQRPTMAASRLIMTDFFLKYRRILVEAGLEITLMKVYVDDGRHVTSLLKPGMRYEKEEKKYRWSAEAEEEDIARREQGEDKGAFMARLCLPAMNDVNEDLTFTAEVESDFKNSKLPTLDFNLWMSTCGRLHHTYYEKEMKTQKMLEKDSAMAIKQKQCILGNELTRRLYNVDTKADEEEEEVQKIIENYTRQAKNSGWGRREVREMVISGYLGWKRRILRRLEQGGQQYRSAASSLGTRTRTKLTGKETWYKEEKKRKRDKYDEMDEVQSKKHKSNEPRKQQAEKKAPVAVMFVPYTEGGELARRLREVEMEQEKASGFRIKIVERSGMRLVDMLHRANPWQGQDCKRPKCLLCKTKIATEKNMEQDCTKRCIVYETWCLTCERRDREKILEGEQDEKKQKEMIKGMRIHKYIGETSRSAYERGLEHQKDLDDLKIESHMLKHYIENHENEKIEDMEFGMKIVRKPRTAFNRQVAESVLIQSNKNHHILNSKSEYNQCALPRLTAMIGEESLA